jgi:hypothetical protein
MPKCSSCPHASKEAVKALNKSLEEDFGTNKGAFCVCMRDGHPTGLIFSPYPTFPCPPEQPNKKQRGLEKFLSL